MQATYDPTDNKLRLYASARLDAETYQRVKAAGFKWAPQQGLFVAPMWTPQREDLLIELAGEIGDEDTSLTDRAGDRAERFEDYSDKRQADADAAHKAVAAIADGIPLGQPILVGHHSEKHARKDAERIENGMRKAVQMWRTSQYWEQRAKGAIRHAKYKERPDVRARRIKGLEADLRKQERCKTESEARVKLWSRPLAGLLKRKDGSELTVNEAALYLAGRVAYLDHDTYRRLEKQEITGEEAQAIFLKRARHTIEHCDRWIEHYQNRLTYERAMLEAAGGTLANPLSLEQRGAVRCWASPRGGWSYIQKVNKVSVTIHDNWGNGGRDFRRVIEFDKLAGVMTAAEVVIAREQGRLIPHGEIGFYLKDQPPSPPQTDKPAQENEVFREMAETIKQGVSVKVVPQLFPTPPDVAARVVELAEIAVTHRVLEPSAGTGAILSAIGERGESVDAVERNEDLAKRLDEQFADVAVHCADFLCCDPGGLWTRYGADPEPVGMFDRIVMNPPFHNGEDIKHVEHALRFLNRGGRLVAIVANGPRQRDALRSRAAQWIPLPAGTFAGTMVNAAICVINNGLL